MPNTSQSAGLHEPKLLLCSGRDCTGKYRNAVRDLESTARDVGVKVESVGCQGSCSGPTAVVVVDGDHRWFEKLRKRKQRAEVVALASREISTPSKKLLERELTGGKRKKAAKKLGVS